MKSTKIQWHPGFVAAMNLDLLKNREALSFEREYNLNTKPLEIDLLIIKKVSSVQIINHIGEFFRGHNILEYKSAKDHLDIDTFFKAEAYAALYKSYGKFVDERKADDITVSLLRETKPRGLFTYLKKHGYSISIPHNGIYRIEGKVLFRTQIVVIGELDWEGNVWVKALSGKIGKDNICKLFEEAGKMCGEQEREYASSVLQVAVEANKQTLEEMMGDGGMYEALMELMEPQIKLREKAKEEEGRKKGRREGIKGTIDVLRDFGHEDAEIKAVVTKKYGLSETEVEEYFYKRS